MAFKLVVSDPKSRKSYQKEVSGEGIIGKKIGDKFSGSAAGLDGYELQITGGSDKDGFPMRKDVDGGGRKRILLSGPPGFHPRLEGQRKRKFIRGNTVSEDMAQVNAKVVKEGKDKLGKIFGGEKVEKPSEEPKEEAPAEEKPESAPEDKKEEEPPAEEPEEEKPPEKDDIKNEAQPEEKKE
ncbi:MAG: 30S ribosomal protein S6e [Candidatus Aenigmatarchaeota archaeon]|nr:MAG: 30S ribosomal protein S6e [Candidatus Aenigmarchaeota archaeon]